MRFNDFQNARAESLPDAQPLVSQFWDNQSSSLPGSRSAVVAHAEGASFPCWHCGSAVGAGERRAASTTRLTQQESSASAVTASPARADSPQLGALEIDASVSI
jgi:hypothetical protein